MSKAQVIGVVRHVLTFAGGVLAMMGIGDSETWATVAGTVATLVGTIWSVFAPEKKESK